MLVKVKWWYLTVGGSADVDGNAGIVGIDSKPSEATVDEAMGNVGGPDGVEVVVVPPEYEGWLEICYIKTWRHDRREMIQPPPINPSRH